MGNRPFMFPFRTFSVLLKVLSAYPGPFKVRWAFLEEIFMRRSWRKLFEKQAYRVVTPIENPYSQCIFCPYPLPRFPFPLEPWGKPCFRSNLLGYVVDLSVELVFLEKDGLGRIMRSVHLRSVHTYFLKFSSLLYGVVRRCFEVQQNGDYCYYPTNGSLALGVVGIRSIFFRWFRSLDTARDRRQRRRAACRFLAKEGKNPQYQLIVS